MGTVLIPIPDRDFDPTEVAVSWQVLRANGHRVVFATESGTPGVADDIMVTGRGLDFWSVLPLLNTITVVGRCCAPTKTPAALTGTCWPRRNTSTRLVGRKPPSTASTGCCCRAAIAPAECALTSTATCCIASSLTPSLVGRSSGAICHGVLLAARSVDPATGHSVLYGHRTTAQTWTLERTAWRLSRITRFWDPDYYRTYTEEPGQPSGYISVNPKSPAP